MNPKTIADIYPLSPMQEGMLFHSIYSPNSGVYIEQISVEITGNLDILAFEEAWQQAIARHPILRTAFVWEGVSSPLQVAGRSAKLPVSFHDWQPISQEQQQQQIESLLQAESDRGFELHKAPLMRLILIRLAETKYHFIWSHHHILLDGWSTSILLDEIFTSYRAICAQQQPNIPRSRPYRDYISWLKSQDLTEAENFWRERLKGFDTVTKLGIDKGRKDRVSEEFDRTHLTLETTVTAQLQAIARQHQLTLNTLFQAAWAILLSRYSGETDVVFGTTVSGRPASLAGADAMVGLFINTLPVRVEVAGEKPLLPWLQQFQTQQAESRQYENTSLAQIQQWSQIPADLPLFDSLLVFENFPFNADLEGDLQIERVEIREQTNYPLTLIVKPGSSCELELLYDAQRFEPEAIARTLKHLTNLLESIATNPHRSIYELPYLTQEETEQLLVTWNQESPEKLPTQSIVELFDLQTAKSPDAIATICGDSQITYQELNLKSTELATYLSNLGVAPNSIIGICCDRSLEMVIAILAVLKSGCAYLPLDPDYPPSRLELMLQETQTPAILTQSHLIPHLPHSSATIISLDKLPPHPNSRTDVACYVSNSLLLTPYSLLPTPSLAYIIYTSGSTGQPKGAMNTHLGIANRLVWMQETYGLTPADRVLQKTPFSFDVSVWEFLWTLISGATLVMAKPGGHRDASYLVELIQQQQITTIHFVPSMLQVFLQEERVRECKSLKRVICSGEALSFDLQQKFFATFEGVELHNLYGPTEAAIDVTYWQCQRDSSDRTVPIGSPIANTQIYILDRYLQPVPVGIPGELHVGGVGLAAGYLKRPELTKEKFIPHPFSQNPVAKLYKTGDLARYRSDGKIEFLGRADNQVKIRGLRIELEEIETAIQQYPGVETAIATAQGDSLIAGILPTDINSPPDIGDLRQFLQTKLPKYAVPATFLWLDSLPLTPSGKLDRKSLNSADLQKPKETAKVLPRNPLEINIANIWAQILNLPEIGIEDNFFEIGGHSLRATQAISKIRQSLQLEVPLDLLFAKPTIADLAAEIEKLQATAPQKLANTTIQAVSRRDRTGVRSKE